MGAAYSACGGEDKSIQILAGKHGRMKPLGTTRRNWEGNVKMDVREIGWSGVDWINLAQDRDKWPALVKTVMLFRFPQDEGNLLTS
jgi:hypothetical protein